MDQRVIIVFIFFCLTLFLSGCWDYTEIERMEFVAGLGVERIEPEVVLITELITPTGVGEQAEFKPFTEAKSILGAARALSNPGGLHLFYPHAEVYLVSEEVARQGVLPAIELIVGGRELRTSVFFFVTKDCTVEEVFKSKPPIVDSVSEHLSFVVELHALIPVFYPQRMWEFRKDMVESGKSGVLPTVQLVNDGGKWSPL